MGYDLFSGWNFPDMSSVKEFFASMQKLTRSFIEATQGLQEALRPFVEATENYRRKMQEIGQFSTTVLRPLSAIGKLQAAQFVWWERMPEDFIDAIVTSKNTNKTLRQFMLRDRFAQVNHTIENTCANPNMKKHIRLYTQSVNAFRNGDSDLAVNGFASVFDGLLSEASKNPTHRMPPRIEVIKGKLERKEIMNSDDFALITLVLTFEKTVDTYVKPSDFSGKEPQGLNRHWIAHGRSKRRKTKLDCVKMINLIWGLLLVQELDETATKGTICKLEN